MDSNDATSKPDIPLYIVYTYVCTFHMHTCTYDAIFCASSLPYFIDPHATVHLLHVWLPHYLPNSRHLCFARVFIPDDAIPVVWLRANAMMYY